MNSPFIIKTENVIKHIRGIFQVKKLYSFLLLAALALVVAACGSNSDNADKNDNNASGNDGDSSASGEVEIFSWWTGAGEEEGLLAMIDLFEDEHPDIAVENAAVAGGAGTNAKAVLATR